MSESDQGGAGRREVAYRLFAAEFEDADYSYSKSDEERAPNYVVTPTGARVNRLFVVGVLTEVEEVSEDVLRGRVVDPTGAFVLYAGQYQPDEQAFLDGAQTPTFVAVTGKARTFQPEDSDQVYTSVRPESISEVDAPTRDRWTVQTAEQTLDRVATMASALDADTRGSALEAALEESGVDEGLAAGVPLAIEHYGTTPGYLSELRSLALDAARLVAGDVEEVEGLTVGPSDGSGTGAADLAADLELSSVAASTADGDSAAGTETALETEAPAETETAADTSAVGDSEPTPDTDTTASTTEATTEAGGQKETTAPAADSQTEAEASVEESTATDSEPTTSEPTGTEADASDSTEEVASTTSEATTPDSSTSTGSPADTTARADAPSKTSTATDATADAGSASEESDEDIGDFEPGEFELDEDEREEIEEEYGTEFQSGTEVPDPGEADIETPDPEELDADESEEVATEPSTEPDVATDAPDEGDAVTENETTEEGRDAEPAPEADADTEDSAEAETAADETEPDPDVDLEDAAVDLMGELDDGGGADRSAVVEALVERHGASEADADEAIQDALMDGRCYEPDDDKLMPI